MRDLPSLDSLVFFEAVARHRSFSRAAAELGVSQAAVSKRIANLEKLLGYLLFSRASRKPALTAEAASLYESTKVALSYLDVALSGAGEDIEAPVRIGTNSTTLSTLWLQAAMSEFTLSENSRNVTLLATDDMDELLSAKLDVAIIYGDGRISGWNTRPIMDEVLAPVASPEVADRFRRVLKYGIDDPDLAPPLLNYPKYTPDWVTWNGWITDARNKTFAGLNRISCKSYCHSIGEALKGAGIALGSISLLEPKIRSGHLERVSENSLKTGRGYHLGMPEDRKISDNMQQVIDFLIASCAGDGTPFPTNGAFSPKAYGPPPSPDADAMASGGCA